jgi:hypothetical protein
VEGFDESGAEAAGEDLVAGGDTEVCATKALELMTAVKTTAVRGNRMRDIGAYSCGGAPLGDDPIVSETALTGPFDAVSPGSCRLDRRCAWRLSKIEHSGPPGTRFKIARNEERSREKSATTGAISRVPKETAIRVALKMAKRLHHPYMPTITDRTRKKVAGG